MAAGHGLEDLLAIFDDPGSQNSIDTIPKPGEIPWPFLDNKLMIRNLMLISEHLLNLPNFEAHSLFVGPSVGPIPVLVNVASGIAGASVASLPLRLVPVPPARRSCRTYSPGGIAGREDVVFCDLPLHYITLNDTAPQIDR